MWRALFVLVALAVASCGKPVTCQVGGRVYRAGDSFPAGDGCNGCECRDDGRVLCTLEACASDSNPATPCAPVNSAGCTIGPPCGSGCCGQGERCVDSMCRCGDGSVCGSGDVCSASKLGADGCGMTCCPPGDHARHDTRRLRCDSPWIDARPATRCSCGVARTRGADRARDRGVREADDLRGRRADLPGRRFLSRGRRLQRLHVHGRRTRPVYEGSLRERIQSRDPMRAGQHRRLHHRAALRLRLLRPGRALHRQHMPVRRRFRLWLRQRVLREHARRGWLRHDLLPAERSLLAVTGSAAAPRRLRRARQSSARSSRPPSASLHRRSHSSRNFVRSFHGSVAFHGIPRRSGLPTTSV